MAGYRSIPVIVRPSDLRARTVPADVAQAVRSGRARYVGFEGQGDPATLLGARLATVAVSAPTDPKPTSAWVAGETIVAPRGMTVGDVHRRGRALSDMTVRMVAADEVDADAWVPGDHRGVGVTGPSRRGA